MSDARRHVSSLDRKVGGAHRLEGATARARPVVVIRSSVKSMGERTVGLGAMGMLLGATLHCGNSSTWFFPTPTEATSGSGGEASTGEPGTGGDIAFTTSGDGGSTGNVGSAGGTGGEGGTAPEPFCGDGKIDPGEVCDDSNAKSGDGCSANCKAIEKEFACPEPGKPCVSTVVCGDGKVTGSETCDDQNSESGDGCSASCKVELGWKCLVIGAACEADKCGDGVVAGNEECEDDDAPPTSGDGCDATCQLEAGWVCKVPGQPCVPTVCGDGVTEGSEGCDDSNHDMGDGCTPFCLREPDCSLSPAQSCTSSCGDGIKLPGGDEECEDGNTKAGDGCSPTCKIEPGYKCADIAADPSELVLPIVLRDFKQSHPDMEYVIGTDKGIVGPELGPNQKPVYAKTITPTTTGKANFDQWYVDTPGVNMTLVQGLVLTKQANGTFLYNSASFFPLNDLGWGNEGNFANFHFTSEVRYWFQHKGGEQLDFAGDDDVWVFVNKQLAVDLGGVHGPQSASVKLGGNFNLVVGKIYEVVVFQAERHLVGSNYKLTLGNFANATSTCQPVCGDGIKTPNEVCDDGINDGSYGHCTADCNWGPYCGDGVVQAPFEECDDGVNLTPYGGCAPGCKSGGFCGDGVIDSVFGEQCDDGVNDGGYGECGPGCVPTEICGDGVVQMPLEECDDGNNLPNDGCSPNCKNENAN